MKLRKSRSSREAQECLEKERQLKKCIRRKLHKGMKSKTKHKTDATLAEYLMSLDKLDTGYISKKTFSTTLKERLIRPLSSSEVEYLVESLPQQEKKVQYDELCYFLGMSSDTESSGSSDNAGEKDEDTQTENLSLGNQALIIENKMRRLVEETGTEKLQVLFEKADKDLSSGRCTGLLNFSEYQQIFQKLGVMFTSTDMRLFASKFEQEKKGKLNYARFLERYNHNAVELTAKLKLLRFIDKFRQDDDKANPDPLRSLRKYLEKVDSRYNEKAQGFLSSAQFLRSLQKFGLELSSTEFEALRSSAEDVYFLTQAVLNKNKKAVAYRVDYMSFIRKSAALLIQKPTAESTCPKYTPSDLLSRVEGKVKNFLTRYLCKYSGESGGQVSQGAFETADRMRHRALTGSLEIQDFRTTLKTTGLHLTEREYQVLISKLIKTGIATYSHVDYINFLRYFEEDGDITLTAGSRLFHESNCENEDSAGSLVDWLSRNASGGERRNFEDLMSVLTEFSARWGVEMETDHEVKNILMKLGPRLGVNLKFQIF